MLYIEVCSRLFNLHVSRFNEAIVSNIKFSFSLMGNCLIMPMFFALSTRLSDCEVILAVGLNAFSGTRCFSGGVRSPPVEAELCSSRVRCLGSGCM